MSLQEKLLVEIGVMELKEKIVLLPQVMITMLCKKESMNF